MGNYHNTAPQPAGPKQAPLIIKATSCIRNVSEKAQLSLIVGYINENFNTHSIAKDILQLIISMSGKSLPKGKYQWTLHRNDLQNAINHVNNNGIIKFEVEDSKFSFDNKNIFDCSAAINKNGLCIEFKSISWSYEIDYVASVFCEETNNRAVKMNDVNSLLIPMKELYNLKSLNFGCIINMLCYKQSNKIWFKEFKMKETWNNQWILTKSMLKSPDNYFVYVNSESATFLTVYDKRYYSQFMDNNNWICSLIVTVFDNDQKKLRDEYRRNIDYSENESVDQETNKYEPVPNRLVFEITCLRIPFGIKSIRMECNVIICIDGKIIEKESSNIKMDEGLDDGSKYIRLPEQSGLIKDNITFKVNLRIIEVNVDHSLQSKLWRFQWPRYGIELNDECCSLSGDDNEYPEDFNKMIKTDRMFQDPLEIEINSLKLQLIDLRDRIDGKKQDVVVEYKDVKSWLDCIGLEKYEDVFVKNGFDSMGMVKEINSKQDLEDIGVVLKAHQLKLMNAIKKLR